MQKRSRIRLKYAVYITKFVQKARSFTKNTIFSFFIVFHGVLGFWGFGVLGFCVLMHEVSKFIEN